MHDIFRRRSEEGATLTVFGQEGILETLLKANVMSVMS